MATNVPHIQGRKEFGCIHRIDVTVARDDGCYAFLSDDDLAGFFYRLRMSHAREKGAPSRWQYVFSDERTAFAFKMRFG